MRPYRIRRQLSESAALVPGCSARLRAFAWAWSSVRRVLAACLGDLSPPSAHVNPAVRQWHGCLLCTCCPSFERCASRRQHLGSGLTTMRH